MGDSRLLHPDCRRQLHLSPISLATILLRVPYRAFREASGDPGYVAPQRRDQGVIDCINAIGTIDTTGTTA